MLMRLLVKQDLSLSFLDIRQQASISLSWKIMGILVGWFILNRYLWNIYGGMISRSKMGHKDFN